MHTNLFLTFLSIRLTVLLLFTDGAEGQYVCEPATPPPPELRPTDNDARLLPECQVSRGDLVQKSGISETTAQQLALCNSFCIDLVLTRVYPDTEDFQGYPVWTLVTLSYLVAPEEGKTTDCLTGDNGCRIDCEIFPYFGDPLDPRFSGYRRALDCKRSCIIKLKSPQITESDCASTCCRECLSQGCQCRDLWNGCRPNVAPPCGLNCNPSDCYFGCGYADSYLTGTRSQVAVNPTQAPELTLLDSETLYMINITNSIPSGVSNRGYSTLIVRVQDLSSRTPNDYTYYVMENGFEFDLAPFLCRKIAVSFSVASYYDALSSYSSSVILDIFSGYFNISTEFEDFNNLAAICAPSSGFILFCFIYQTICLF